MITRRLIHITLINLINLNYPDYHIILIGSTAEKNYVEGIVSACDKQEKIISLAGKTSIQQLIGVIQQASLLITNDTGPMHIGFATKTKTLALFGPCSPNQYGFNKNCFPIYKNVYCSPCVHEFERPPCNGNNECMRLIEVSEVMQLIDAVLHHPQFANELQQAIVYHSDNLPLADFPVLGFVCR